MRRKTKLYASALLVLCIVLIVGYFALWSDTNVTVYDDRFKIIDYSMSMGMTQIYDGNQTIGRIKARLRSAFGLKFINPPGTILKSGPENLVLLVRYRGDLPFEEVGGLVAVVRNDDDFFKQMWGKNRYDRDRQIFTGLFISAHAVPKSNDSLRVDFYLSSEYDELIATLRVGELKKYKKKRDGAM